MMRYLLILSLSLFLILLGSGCSTNSSGSISALPVPPANLNVTVVSNTQITLTWTDNSTNESGFKIDRKIVGGTYSLAGTVGPNITTFNDLGLASNTTYSYRVYSYNADGNSPTYSNEVTATTNASGTTTICSQVWSTKNLDVITYRNGDPIPKVTTKSQLASLTTGAYCYYNNDSATYAATFGKLYNWYAVTDPRGLAPTGWHIPSESEWNTLSTCLGGMAIAGGKMKAVSPLWFAPNTGATNSSGFTALPGGYMGLIGLGNFFSQGGGGHWWTITPSTQANYSRSVFLNTNSENLGNQSNDNHNAFSVRCIQD